MKKVIYSTVLLVAISVLILNGCTKTVVEEPSTAESTDLGTEIE